VKGCHSVMLKPDSVNRVRPPMTTIPNTSAEQPKSQLGSDRGIAADVAETSAVAARDAEAAVASNAAVVRRRIEGEKKVVDRAIG
jgi:hypothetical protein